MIGPVVEVRHGNALGQPLAGEGERWRWRAVALWSADVDDWLQKHECVEIVQISPLGIDGNDNAAVLVVYREREENK